MINNIKCDKPYIGIGNSHSKKQAEELAAADALNYLNKLYNKTEITVDKSQILVTSPSTLTKQSIRSPVKSYVKKSNLPTQIIDQSQIS